MCREGPAQETQPIGNLSVRFIKAVIYNVLIFLLLLEIGLFSAAKLNVLKMDLPSYSLANARPFWEDRNPDFGVWHAPDRAYRHLKSCFNVTYRTNASGMRDARRDLHAAGPRVAVLGDSFIEGFGVASGDRLTDRLERITHIPHLNFGTSGSFGLTQSWLLYKTFASKFDHDAVIISILPDNDFTDDDFEKGRKIHYNRYRPYLVGTYPDYALRYYDKDLNSTNVRMKIYLMAVERFFKEFSYTIRAYEYYKAYFWAMSAGRKTATGRNASGWRVHSKYYDYTQAEFDRMRYAVEQIAALAKPRPVLIMSIPRGSDYTRANAESGPAPLTRQLRDLARALGAAYVDLLEQTRDTGDISQYFHSCDPHWNAAGHGMAARELKDWGYYGKQPQQTASAVSR